MTKDQTSPRLVVGADLPLRLDQVTPQWMSEALSVAYPGVKVASVKQEGGWKGTTISARFVLGYADEGGHADLPAAVYLKGGFDDKWRKRVWVALHHEARFYSEIAPDVSINIPRCFYAGINDCPQGIVFLEDLSERGVRFGQELAPVTADDVAAVLEQLARLHADWWGSPKLDRFMDWGEPQRLYSVVSWRPKHWEELSAWKHGDLLRQALVDPDTAVRSLRELWSVMDGKPRTFLHGDPHGGNVYYELDGRPGLLDWQCCFAGNHTHDMSWIIVSSFTVDQRRKHEGDMIRHYLGALKAYRGEAPEFDQAWLAYRQNMAHAAVSYGAIPRDGAKPFVLEGAAERVFTGAIDLDLLGSLGVSRS